MAVGLGTSMWAGVSGLLAHSTAMTTIGNNLANVSTVGFKGARTDFSDLMSATIGTGSGEKQIGLGTQVETLVSDFSQGGFQTSGNTTDMAINGNGFFMVKKKSQIGSNGALINSENSTTYYTRAGDFTFDSDGYLVNPNGLAVQGWKVDQDRIDAASASGNVLTETPTTGQVQDIHLDNFSCPAKATSTMTLITNLDSSSKSATTRDATQPDYFYAMSESWDGTKDPAMPSTAYDYQTTMKVYDGNGQSHTLTVYYDKVATDNGKSYWEYSVTCDPSEDGRKNPDTATGTPFAGTKEAGMLMTGTLTFDDSGNLENMSSYTLKDGGVTDTNNFNAADWTKANTSNGAPVFTANFRFASGASFTNSSNPINIKLNFGISNINGFVDGASGDSLSGVGSDPNNLVSFNSATTKINSAVTTNYATSSSTVFNSQDGYTAGLLTKFSVDKDGVLTGTFSNGQTQKLWVLALANFNNLQGLSRTGSNLYSATLDSGQALVNRANTATVGSVAGNTLESSNVDMASEMVNMILTQRGFEANSKTITTVDSMLSEVIQLKR